jgi:hypothetical protein
MLAKWPPLKLAQLAFAASLLSMSRILAPLLALIPFALHRWKTDPRQADRLWLYFLIAMVPALIGIVLLGLAKRRITDGVRRELWIEQETRPALKWLRSPIVTRGWWVILAAMSCCYLMIFLVPRDFHSADPRMIETVLLIFAMLLPSPRTSLDQIRKALSPEPPRSSSRTLDMKRLQSEHWGGREFPKPGRSEA